MANCNSPLIVALDYPDAGQAMAMARRLDPARCRAKVGKELFTRAGPDIVRQLQDAGFDVFLDMKYHDIPNTVAGAVDAAAELGVWMVNVHAGGGRAMMLAARDAADRAARPPLLIAVTVLTSLSASELAETGVAVPLEVQVLKLARLAREAALDGVVCSARESRLLRATLGPDFLLVTPGIRPQGASADDQQRIVTPAAAIADGSNYLVVGRPVTRAADPAAAVEQILQSLAPSMGA